MADPKCSARSLVVGATALLLIGGIPDDTARAAQLELAAPTSPVPVGQRFSIAVSGIGFPNGADGGDLSLFWSGNLAFVGLSIESATWETSAVDTANVAQNFIGSIDVFSADDTPGNGGARFPVARLTLEARAEGPARIDLGVDRVGWSLGGGGLDYTIGPGIDLDIVPLPEPSLAATIAGGIGWLGALARSPRRR